MKAFELLFELLIRWRWHWLIPESRPAGLRGTNWMTGR